MPDPTDDGSGDVSDPDDGGDPTDADDFAAVLLAGAAVYNAGEHHAAHDAWEDRWLDLDSGTDDERLLHGLIQFTAAVYHARNGNWSGAVGLAGSAEEYLDGLPADYRGVDLASVRAYLRRLEADPERVERGPPPRLVVDGDAPDAYALSLAAVGVAAAVVAEEYGHDESVVADAVRFARETRDPDDSQYARFLRDFVGNPDGRGIVFERLSGLVERHRREERDVAGLFDGDAKGDENSGA